MKRNKTNFKPGSQITTRQEKIVEAKMQSIIISNFDIANLDKVHAINVMKRNKQILNLVVRCSETELSSRIECQNGIDEAIATVAG